MHVGRHGASFQSYTFRSMSFGADPGLAALAGRNEASDDLLFTMRDDPRVTRLGALLRRFSRDELPQLINVALGHMSIVGRRPPLPHEVARYERDIHHRLFVKQAQPPPPPPLSRRCRGCPC